MQPVGSCYAARFGRRDGRAAGGLEGEAIDEARRASAQADLRRGLESAGERAILLAGAAGAGKTTLLHAIASELAPRRSPVYLAHPRLPLGGFWMRLASELDLEPGYDAKRRVLRRAAELAREGGALLLLVDDAAELPAETLYALIAAARSEPGLQLVLARADDTSLAGPLPDDVPVVRIGSPPPAAPRAAAPEPVASALPALTARRRTRERRARGAFAAGGVLVGVALGLLVSGPAWQAVEALLARPPASAPEEAASLAPPPSEDAPPLELSERSLPSPAVADALPAAEPEAVPSEPMRPPAEPPPLAAAPPAAGAPPPAAARLPAAVPPATAAPAVAAAPPQQAAQPEAPPAAVAAQPGANAAPSPAEPLPAAPAPSLAAPPPSVASPPPSVAAPPPSAPRPRAGPPALGRLAVTSDSAVRIEIDGRAYGAAPLFGVQLSKGEHRVLAYYPDGAVALKTIYLDTEDVSVFFR